MADKFFPPLLAAVAESEEPGTAKLACESMVSWDVIIILYQTQVAVLDLREGASL